MPLRIAMADYLHLLMFAILCIALLGGFPVALTLAGTALCFAVLGMALDAFEPAYLRAFPNRILGAMRNQILTAVPLFILMGVLLEKSGVAKNMLSISQRLLSGIRGGMAGAIVLVGALLAASTGIVGATVVTMTLLALPTMLAEGYDRKLSTGIIAASGTLGQIIPPSIILIILADIISNAGAEASRLMGEAPRPVSVGDLFAGALIPGLLLVLAYLSFLLLCVLFRPSLFPPVTKAQARPTPGELLLGIGAPLILIIAVLGSIIGGLASPTEAASIGAGGAILLAGARISTTNSQTLLIGSGGPVFAALIACGASLNTASGAGFIIALPLCLLFAASIIAALLALWRADILADILRSAAEMTSMVFLILIGAALFSIVFRGLGGDDAIASFLATVPGGMWGALLISMLAMFVLGFFLDFLEISFILVPVLAPPLIMMGADPVWLGILIAINLQTSFLTPPFGFALFYLKGAAPPDLAITDIWRGAIPFIIIQILILAMIMLFPQLIWTPG